MLWTFIIVLLMTVVVGYFAEIRHKQYGLFVGRLVFVAMLMGIFYVYAH